MPCYKGRLNEIPGHLETNEINGPRNLKGVWDPSKWVSGFWPSIELPEHQWRAVSGYTDYGDNALRTEAEAIEAAKQNGFTPDPD